MVVIMWEIYENWVRYEFYYFYQICELKIDV